MTRETRQTFLASLAVAVVASVLFWIDPHFFLKDDFALQFLPGSRDVVRAWTHAELPLLSPYSWTGTALGAEYQYGVFSIARVAIDSIAWLLPLPLTGRAFFLFLVYAMIAAAGAYRLARSYDVRPSFAMMVAIIAALNGWNVWWGTAWFVAVAAFAWIPWYWLALRGIARGTRWSWLGAAISAYLIVAAGSPYVAIMAAPIVVLSLVTGRNRTSMLVWSALGVLLAAPAVLMLAEVFGGGARMAGQTRIGSMWMVPVTALIGAIVPAYQSVWPVFLESRPHRAVELLGAFVPLVAIVAGFRKRILPVLALALFALAMAMLPSIAPLQWSFHWLPLFHLALAVAGACALENVKWLRYDVLPALITGVILIVAFVPFSQEGEVPVFTNHDVLLGRGPYDPARRYLAMYDRDAIIGADRDGRRNRGMNLELRPGNTPMIAGLHFINGYSPLGSEGLATLFRFELHGTMPPDRAEEILRYESGRNQLLHHLGIDGLVVPTSIAARNAALLANNGWKPVARVDGCIVLHRTDRLANPLFQSALAIGVQKDVDGYRAIAARTTPQLPVVLLGTEGVRRYGHRDVGNVRVTRLQASLDVRGKGPRALIVFRRPWLPGLHATLNGESLPVLRADMIMPAVELPADASGEVRLFYRPASLLAGALLAGLAIVVLSFRIRATWSRT